MRPVADSPDRREREPVDLRLAAGAAAAWLAVLLCGSGSAGAALTVAVLAAGLGLTVLAVARRRRGAAALALALFCVALALLPLAARLVHARAAPLYGLAREHAAVTATITVAADPVPLAARGVAGSARVLVAASADAVTVRGLRRSADGTIVVLADAQGWRDVLPGQQLRIDGRLQPDLDGSALSVTLFASGPPQLLGRPPWWQRAAGAIRSALRRAARVLPAQERGLLPGLVDGDTAGLDPVLADRFRTAGLTHLVAVSGTNCAILIGFVLLVLRRLRLRPWLCAVLGGLALLMFVVVARPSPSVLRAALMALIALASLATGRPRAAVPGLAAAVLALLVWDPTLAANASFVMSVLATVALLLIAPGWARALHRRRVPLLVAESVAVAAAAHLVTAPVVAAISGQVSLVAIPANVLAEPVVAVITVLGFGAALLAPLWLAGGTALAWLAGWPCRWLVGVADYFGGLTGAVLPWPGGSTGGLLLLGVTVVVGLVAARAGPRRVLGAAAATALVIAFPVRSATSTWPPAGWLFLACDVGQGDALLLPAGPGAAVVIDTGPDPVVLDRCLRRLDIDEVPLLVLTHFHLDHVGGLPGLVRGRRVGRLLTGPLDAPDAGAMIVDRVAAQLRLPVLSPPPGTHLDVGAVHLDVLGPRGPYHNTHSDPNNSSLVLRAEVGGVRILLPGDAEIEAQQDLLAAGADVRADVLKVAHHGSAYFAPEFLAAVHAEVAVVSVGAHNDYGHPSPVLLRALARLGVPLLRTDRDGDVAIAGRPGRLRAVARGTGTGVGAIAQARAAAPLTVAVRSSAVDARMAPCRLAPSASTTSPIHCRAWSCSSATKTCSSTGPSARSPPLLGAPTPTPPRPRSPGVSWTAPSSPSCSVLRSSATRGCWSCEPLRTCAPPPWRRWGPSSPSRPRGRWWCSSTPAGRRGRRCSRRPARPRRWRSAAPS